MQIDTVGILSPGAMGQAVGAVLAGRDVHVITNLADRSPATRARAVAASMADTASDRALVEQADIVLSILPPAQADALARRIADAAQAVDATLTYIDCNAVAPATTRRIGAVVEAAGLAFVDGGIIGPPPGPDGRGTRLYLSGPRAADCVALRDSGLDIRVVSEAIGDASAVKMCYAALTKGLTAVATQLAVAAQRLGVADALAAEQAESQASLMAQIRRGVPAMVPKAQRWVGEMEEIAKTFAACGLAPKIFEGAAELYDFVAENAPPPAADGDDAFDHATRALAEALPRMD